MRLVRFMFEFTRTTYYGLSGVYLSVAESPHINSPYALAVGKSLRSV